MNRRGIFRMPLVDGGIWSLREPTELAIESRAQHLSMTTFSLAAWNANQVDFRFAAYAPGLPGIVHFESSAEVRELCVGMHHVCILDASGCVLCAGENNVGQLGRPGVGQSEAFTAPAGSSCSSGSR